ncbi:hypothetical protein D6817_03610 [Candidatus Pacearchaeota archaeon]|nr:MAG: hypothetical protein D6817_03610 [Candidatus Pacearchaeota archaeon]
MALEVFSSPEQVFLLSAAVILVAIVVLTLIERQLKKRVQNKKLAEQKISEDEIARLQNLVKSKEKFLFELRAALEEFIKKSYNMRVHTTYTELVSRLRSRGKTRAADILEKIEFYLYSGERVERKQLIALLKSYEKLIGYKKPEENTKESKKTNFTYFTKLMPRFSFSRMRDSPQPRNHLSESHKRPKLEKRKEILERAKEKPAVMPAHESRAHVMQKKSKPIVLENEIELEPEVKLIKKSVAKPSLDKEISDEIEKDKGTFLRQYGKLLRFAAPRKMSELPASKVKQLSRTKKSTPFYERFIHPLDDLTRVEHRFKKKPTLKLH